MTTLDRADEAGTTTCETTDSLTCRAIELASRVFAQKENLEARLVRGGITNILIRVHTKNDDTNNGVVVRFFGKRTSRILNRPLTDLVASHLQAHGVGKRVHHKFSGGQVEEWIPGRSLTQEEMRTPEAAAVIAEKLAHLHAVPFGPDIQRMTSDFWDERAFSCSSEALQTAGRVSVLWTNIIAWAALCKEILQSGDARGYRGEALAFIDFDTICKKIHALCEERAQRVKSRTTAAKIDPFDIVLGHNDLLAGNIVRRGDDVTSVSFIDYEYAGPAERAFDIANHFCEMCGFESDWDRYPDAQFQRYFVEAYLQKCHPDQPCSDAEVTRFLEGVAFFNRVSHLFWGLWAAAQAMTSTVDFDYAGYALRRLLVAFDATGQSP